MAAGIRIPFISDVTDFLRGTKNIEQKLDDVGDALDDVAKEGDQATEKLERSFDDLADSVDQSFKSVRTSARKNLDDAADDVKGSKFKDTGSEIGAEFSENIGEGLRSGNYAGVLEETGTSLSGALGPLGIFVGVGTALVANIIKGMDDQKQAITAKAGEIFQLLLDNGATYITELQIQQGAAALMYDEGFAKLKQAAEDAGIPVSQLARALSGDTEALEGVKVAMGNVGTAIEGDTDIVGRGIEVTSKAAHAMTEDINTIKSALDIHSQAALDAERNLIRYAAANAAAATSIEAVSNAYKRGDYVAALSAEAKAEQAQMRTTTRSDGRP